MNNSDIHNLRGDRDAARGELYLRHVDAVAEVLLLQLFNQRRAIHSQNGCRAILVPASAFKSLQNKRVFELLLAYYLNVVQPFCLYFHNG